RVRRHPPPRSLFQSARWGYPVSRTLRKLCDSRSLARCCRCLNPVALGYFRSTSVTVAGDRPAVKIAHLIRFAHCWAAGKVEGERTIEAHDAPTNSAARRGVDAHHLQGS